MDKEKNSAKLGKTERPENESVPPFSETWILACLKYSQISFEISVSLYCRDRKAQNMVFVSSTPPLADFMYVEVFVMNV